MSAPTWQQSLSNTVNDYDTLCSMLEIPPDALHAQAIQNSQKQFPLRVPIEFITRMKKGDPKDPLLLQILPQAIEMQKNVGFIADPLEEKKYNPVLGLLHKYPNRVLLTLTGACAINCRYCFRRHFPYADNTPGRAQWQRTFDYIAAHPEIDEVILSGGDPLILKDSILVEFAEQLEKIKHVQRLRLHTRLPIVIPQRVTAAWIDWMQQSRFQMIVVVHCNHANEIDEPVLHALKRLRHSATLLNQSVLLQNVNDSADALVQLSKRLFEADALPYYLHLPDKVDGTAHFDVRDAAAKKLMQKIKKQLPGFLVPKLAREVPGMLHKQFE